MSKHITDRDDVRRMAAQLFNAGFRSCEAAALMGWLTPRDATQVEAVDALLQRIWIVTAEDDKDLLPFTEKRA